MNNRKAVKDLAFEKERAKFRSEIRKLNDCIKDKQEQLDVMRELVREKESVIMQQKDWIKRLLAYTEIPVNDMWQIVERDKKIAEFAEMAGSMQRLFNSFAKIMDDMVVLFEETIQTADRIKKEKVMIRRDQDE